MTLRVMTRLLLCKKHHVPPKTVGNACRSISLAHDSNPVFKSSPVMVNEVIDYLNLKNGDLFLDMTFGEGGHSSALLERIPDLRVIALDRDPFSEKFAKELGEKHPNKVTSLVGRFSDLPSLLKSKGIKQNSFDGILFDLGCSSMQADCPERGFMFSENGPLDMRMDGTRVPDQLTAADVIAYASEKELTQIFRLYGEEKMSLKIAKAIIEARYTFAPLTTTENLFDLISSVCCGLEQVKANRKSNVASKIFLALRIFVNNEINELNYGILLAQKYLKPNGRAVVISFHTVEHGIVKKHFNNHFNCSNILPQVYVNCSKSYTAEQMSNILKPSWKVLTKKVVLPSEQEVCENPKSKSANLRAAAKYSE